MADQSTITTQPAQQLPPRQQSAFAPGTIIGESPTGYLTTTPIPGLNTIIPRGNIIVNPGGQNIFQPGAGLTGGSGFHNVGAGVNPVMPIEPSSSSVIPNTSEVNNLAAQQLQAAQQQQAQVLAASSGLSTISNYNVQSTKDYSSEIRLKPYFKETQISTITDKGTGRQIPVSVVNVVEPGLIDQTTGKLITTPGRINVTERPATTQEFQYYQQNKGALTGAVSSPSSLTREFDEILGKSNQRLYELNQQMKLPISDEALMKSAQQLAYITPVAVTPQAKQVTAGFYYGLAKEVNENLFSLAATAGAGYIAGLALEGVPTLIAEIPRLESFAGLTKGLGYGAGAVATGVYAIKTGADVIAAPDLTTSGSIIGKSSIDLTSFAYGFGKGTTGAKQFGGFISTLGRSEPIQEIPQGIYPAAPQAKQLTLFRTNIFPELSEAPGGFHVTPQVFQETILRIKPGTSELPGLYISTDISTPFSKIPGSGSTLPDSFLDKLDLFVKEITTINKPGVAFVVPESFREVKTGFTGEETFPGQKSIRGKYAYFKAPVKAGSADLPLLKSEIEAIVRPESGDYYKMQDKYFVRINKVRVPLDVYRFVNPTEQLEMELSEPKLVSGKSYEYPTPSRVSIFSGVNALSRPNKAISSAFSSLEVPFSSYAKGSSTISGGSSGDVLVSSASSSIDSSANSIVSSVSSSLSRATGSSGGGSSTGYYFNTTLEPPIYKGKRKERRKRVRAAKAYSAYIKRFGQFRPLAINVSEGKAFRIAEERAIKSLGRTIKVKPTGIIEELDNVSLKLPEERLFRSYRIKKGRKEALPFGTFIKRIGISSEPAVKEIQFYRAAKKGSKRKRK